MGTKRVDLPFGDGTVSVEVPEDARVLRPSDPPLEPLPDFRQALRDALLHPLGLPPLPDLVRPGSTVFIAFDDITQGARGTIRGDALETVMEVLRSAGVREEDIQVRVANALHRKSTREELARVGLGDALVRRLGDRLACHDAEDPENLVYLGRTPNGYEVEVHRGVVESDLTVYINCGYQMGFNGGWKSVCVGLSTWRSIRWTHHPDGMSMSLRNNRMHQVLDEMGDHLERTLGKRVFKVEMLRAGPERVARVWAGGVKETRQQAVETLARYLPPRREMGEPVDIVLYGIPNASPYANFARHNPILTLISYGLGYLGGYIDALGKEGCTVILATPVPEEWDLEHHPSYKEVWDRVLAQTRDPYEMMARFEAEFASHRGYIEQYRFGVAYHPVHALLACHPLKRLRRIGRVFVAGAVDPAVPRYLGFEPFPDVESALAEAYRVHGPDARLLVVDYSAQRRADPPLNGA